MILKISIPILLALPVLLSGSAIEDVAKFVKHFASATTHGVETVDIMKKVLKDSRHFIRLAGPVGNLVALGLEIIFDPKSDDQKALELLSREINANFEAMGAQVTRAQRVIIHEILATRYSTDVTSKLTKTFEYFQSATNPNANRTIQKKIFTDRCSKDGPREVLIDLEIMYITNCPLPRKEDILNLVRIREAFQKLERNPQSLTEKYFDGKNRILQVITSMSSRKAVEIIEKLSSAYVPNASKMDQLITEISNDHYLNATSSCLLSAVYNAHDQQRRFLQLEVKQLAIDLLKSEFLVVACANATLHGDEGGIREWEESANSRVERITYHVANYVEILERHFWPELVESWAKTAIPDSGTIPAYSYNSTASAVSAVIEERGSANLSYQILITDEWWTPSNYWEVITTPAGLHTLFRKNGLVVHIFAFIDGPEARALRASQWLATKEKEFYDHLIGSMSRSGRASYLLDDLKNNCGTLIAEDKYRSVMLITKSVYYESDVHIPTGRAFLPVVSANGSSNVYCFSNPDLLHNANELILFFFI